MEKIILKTGYQWCLEANIRILDLSKYSDSALYEELYYKHEISAKEFYSKLEKCDVKPNSQPRKTEMYLEYRMYGLVPYNLSPIQQGIQFGHAVVEYGMLSSVIQEHTKIYNKWAKEDKTFIILNGGTTNNNPDKLGSLNKHTEALSLANIRYAEFHEPDLGDQLTAVVFLVDERVFNKTLYPDFIPETLPWGRKKPSEKELSILEAKNQKNYEHWVEKIGGPQNAFLREFLKPLRLA